MGKYISNEMYSANLVAIILFFFQFTLTGCQAERELQLEQEVSEQFTIGSLSFSYVGGIRIPGKSFGDSRAAFVPGAFAISGSASSGERADLWLAGRAKDMAIAQFSLPLAVKTRKIGNMPFATVKQPFFSVKPNNSDINVDRITGLELVRNSLFINVAKYYDAAGSVRYTSRVVHNAKNMKNSSISSFFALSGMHHAAGWMSPIPRALQPELGGNYLSGYADNLPIASRASIGPSLFVWEESDFLNAGFTSLPKLTPISTKPIIDFTLSSPFHDDRYNVSGTNNIWTVESRAVFGFIPENSQQYVVLGTSGGHKTGLGYKIVQKNGKRCGGPCAYDPNDYYNYFWIFDLRHNTSSGERSSYDLLNFGELKVDTFGKLISGADYDPIAKKLYLLIDDADKLQNKFEAKPLLLVYKLTN